VTKATPAPQRLALHWRILIGLILGIGVGLVLNWQWTAETWARLGVHDAAAFRAWLPSEQNDPGPIALIARFLIQLNDFVADLFLRGLWFVAVPIVLFSLIVGVSSLNNLRKLSRIGSKTVGIYLGTTAVAITLGLVLANVVAPGRFVPEGTREELAARMQQQAQAGIQRAEARPGAWQTVLEIVPRNPFEALATGQMLQVVFVALLIGIALTLIPRDKALPVIRFCEGMTETIIRIVYIIMIVAPFAVFALVVRMVAPMGMDVLSALIAYVLVVVAGLAIHMLGIYPLLFTLLAGVGYRRFFRAMLPAQLLAFSSSSSAATLPVTMRCTRDRLGVSDEVTSFVVPLGATINMDGTALYQGVAAVFIAQMYNLDLGIGEQLAIVATATLASIGTAGVPGVGTIMLVIVLRAVNIPLEGIAVILGVDRLLDMCRTVVNITGDATVATVVAGTEGGLLSEGELAKRAAAEAGPPPAQGE
jgi:proton glutamate symport protein